MLEHRGNLLMLAISILVLVLGYLLSKSLVKPFTRVSKAIEELTDGYLNKEITIFWIIQKPRCLAVCLIRC